MVNGRTANRLYTPTIHYSLFTGFFLAHLTPPSVLSTMSPILLRNRGLNQTERLQLEFSTAACPQ